MPRTSSLPSVGFELGCSLLGQGLPFLPFRCSHVNSAAYFSHAMSRPESSASGFQHYVYSSTRLPPRGSLLRFPSFSFLSASLKTLGRMLEAPIRAFLGEGRSNDTWSFCLSEQPAYPLLSRRLSACRYSEHFQLPEPPRYAHSRAANLAQTF